MCGGTHASLGGGEHVSGPSQEWVLMEEGLTESAWIPSLLAEVTSGSRLSRQIPLHVLNSLTVA